MIFCNFKQVNYEPQIKLNTRARQTAQKNNNNNNNSGWTESSNSCDLAF